MAFHRYSELPAELRFTICEDAIDDVCMIDINKPLTAFLPVLSSNRQPRAELFQLFHTSPILRADVNAAIKRRQRELEVQRETFPVWTRDDTLIGTCSVHENAPLEWRTVGPQHGFANPVCPNCLAQRDNLVVVRYRNWLNGEVAWMERMLCRAQHV